MIGLFIVVMSVRWSTCLLGSLIISAEAAVKLECRAQLKSMVVSELRVLSLGLSYV